MRRFAEIDPATGAFRCAFDWPDEIAGVPEYRPGVAVAVEVTGLDPEPGADWVYTDGSWVAPTPPPPEVLP